MCSPILALQAGLKAHAASLQPNVFDHYPMMFGTLSVYAAWLVAGDAYEQQRAAEKLQELIAAGTEILAIRELEKKG